MKAFLKQIIGIRYVRRTSMRLFVWLHNLSYKMLTKLAIVENRGKHPKHDILRYHEFFVRNVESTDAVIDIGCGKGENAYDIAAKAKYVVGIDIKAKNIEAAKRKYSRENLEYVVGDVLTYPCTQTFDAVVLSNVLEHIEHRVEFLRALKDVSSKILLRVPMVNRDWLTVYKQQQAFEYRLDPTHFIEYTVETLQSELQASGWVMESYSVQFGELWGVLHDA